MESRGRHLEAHERPMRCPRTTKSDQERPKVSSRAPKMSPRAPKSDPGAPQERPRGAHEHPRAPRSGPWTPKGAPRSAKRGQGRQTTNPKGTRGYQRGSILGHKTILQIYSEMGRELSLSRCKHEVFLKPQKQDKRALAHMPCDLYDNAKLINMIESESISKRTWVPKLNLNGYHIRCLKVLVRARTKGCPIGIQERQKSDQERPKNTPRAPMRNQ